MSAEWAGASVTLLLPLEKGEQSHLSALLVSIQDFPGRTQQEAGWLRSMTSIVYRVPDTAPHNSIKMWACGLEMMTNPQTAGCWARGCLEVAHQGPWTRHCCRGHSQGEKSNLHACVVFFYSWLKLIPPPRKGDQEENRICREGGTTLNG